MFLVAARLASTAGVLLLVPAAARADQYIVDHCTHPDGSPATAFAAVSGFTTSDCGRAGGALRFQQPPSPGGPIVMATNEQHRIALSVPADRPNIQIERVITRYSVPAVSDTPGAGFGFVFVDLHAGSNLIAENQAGSAGPTAPVVEMAVAPGTRSIDWSVVCDASTCFFNDGFILNVFRTRLYLNEDVAPTLTLTGGTLTAASAKHGRMSVAFDAADTDSGVSSMSVALDSTVIGSVDFPCAFNDWSACPRTERDQLLAVDTTKVPDGDHELIVTVRDAANNALTRSLGTVTVANGAASAPETPGGPAPVANARVIASFAANRRATLTVGYGRRAVIRGRLERAGGEPIGGASLTAEQRPASGVGAVRSAAVTTGADGRFSVSLGRGPTRTVLLTYGGATKRLELRVKASATLGVSLSGVLVRYRGRVLSAPLPRTGKTVEIQGRSPGTGWKPFAHRRSNRMGDFFGTYRLKVHRPGVRLQFRVRVMPQSGYPFVAHTGKAVIRTVH